MLVTKNMAAIAAAMASPSRINMLEALAGGIARSATDLAGIADIQTNTATTHLQILCKANLIKVVKQGRYRYFKIKDESVSDLIEALGEQTGVNPKATNMPMSDMAFGRTCYDHLAGWLGVQLTESLIHNQHLIQHEKSFDLTEKGTDFLTKLGVVLNSPKNTRRVFARACLDWTEGEMHVGGALGAELFAFFVAEKWVAKNDDYREVTVLPKGKENFDHYFGISFS
ncbi:MAG: DNA-binding transcriptional ArsR family regulator [Oceanospirillaceae bacterium]|jgi:DNA-binding transcriptional ArsR family regulator